MKIDRTAFLVLTAAIATAGCEVIVEHPEAKTPGQPTPPPPKPPAPHVAQNNATPTPAKPVTPTPQRPRVILTPAHVNPPPTPTPTPTPTPPTPTPAPAACLDSSTTAAVTCATTCSSNPFMAQRCAVYAADFDAKVGATAIACMNGLTGAKACDSQAAYDCGKAALGQACSDSTVAALCQIASTPCKVAQNDCVTMLSGLNAAGQDAVASCVAKGCSAGAGLYSCIEGLTSSTEGVRH